MYWQQGATMTKTAKTDKQRQIDMHWAVAHMDDLLRRLQTEGKR